MVPPFEVEGLTSKTFYVYFSPPSPIREQDYTLYVESILTDLMDAVGPTFTATIKPALPTGGQWSIVVCYPSHEWYKQFAKRLTPIAKKLGIQCVTMRAKDTATGTPPSYILEAKDWTYEKKKIVKTITTMKEITVPWMEFPTTVPHVEIETEEF